MAFFYQPVIFGPGWLSRPRSPEEEDDECFVALLAMACAGTPGLLALSGAIVGFLCVAAAKALHRQYQIYTRKGYYGCERRREEAHRRFEEGMASLSENPESWQARYRQIFADYIAELERIDKDFERQTGRSPYGMAQENGRRPDRRSDAGWREGRNRGNDADRRRDRSWSEGGGSGWSPWASPKAVRGRRRRRAKRLALWREWAQKCAEAMRLGKTPPPSPAERRTGGGAPIRRLCERSSSPPPAPEAILAQYDRAKGRGSVEEKLRLGSMMLDIEAAVDSSLVRDPSGEIVGRNAGVRGWIAENCPALLSHYASLMGYRRLADEFRKVHGLRDPHPAARLLEPEFPAERFAPALREPMRSRHAAARRLLASPAAKSAKGFAEALARTRRAGIVPRRRTG
jgi:hypothetical protein